MRTGEKITPKRALPDFDNPPVVETVLGVRFAPVDGWNVVHFGQLFPKFQPEYPKLQLKPPLGTTEFRFGDQTDFDFPVRCWFINQDDTQLVQIQNNCFIRNWRKTAATPEYRHYDAIKPLFERDWAIFCSFLEEQHLRAPEVWQCEVTYINHFVRGHEWNSFQDLPNLFRVWKGIRDDDLFRNLELASFAASFGIAELAGRLQFSSQPGIRQGDGAEIIQLSITASGKPASSAHSDLLSWLDLGHEAVVSGFTRFTTDDAHKVWGLKWSR